MAFPRELRDAIPPLHDGRVLELESISGQASNTPLFGRVVELQLIVKETGKLRGSFTVLMRLQPEAARKLAGTLTRWWMGQADKRGSNLLKIRWSKLTFPGPEQINQVRMSTYRVSGRYSKSSSQSRNDSRAGIDAS
jgi:hypothetical protein